MCTVLLPPGVNPIAVSKYIYIYIYIHIHVYIYVYMSMSISMSMSICLCLYLYLCQCLSISMSISIYICLYLYLYLYLCQCLSISMSISTRMSIPISILTIPVTCVFWFLLVPFILQEYENRSRLRSGTARTLMMHINGFIFMKLRSLNSDIRFPNHASHFCIQFTQA